MCSSLNLMSKQRGGRRQEGEWMGSKWVLQPPRHSSLPIKEKHYNSLTKGCAVCRVCVSIHSQDRTHIWECVFSSWCGFVSVSLNDREADGENKLTERRISGVAELVESTARLNTGWISAQSDWGIHFRSVTVWFLQFFQYNMYGLFFFKYKNKTREFCCAKKLE